MSLTSHDALVWEWGRGRTFGGGFGSWKLDMLSLEQRRTEQRLFCSGTIPVGDPQTPRLSDHQSCHTSHTIGFCRSEKPGQKIQSIMLTVSHAISSKARKKLLYLISFISTII